VKNKNLIMKKTITLLLLVAVTSLSTFAAKPDLKKFREAIRKSMQAQPSQNSSAGRATESRKIADVYYNSGTKQDSTHYIYNNNFPPYADNDPFYYYFFGDKDKFDSLTYFDNGGVSGTVKVNYSNQIATTYIYRKGTSGDRYSFGYDAQGRFNQYTYDSLTTGGVWDTQGKASITYDAAGKVDSLNSYNYVAGNFVASYRSKLNYNGAGLLATEFSYEYKASQWVLESRYEYTYNGSGKETLRISYSNDNSVFALRDSAITTYPQADIVLETQFYFEADTINGGGKEKKVLNGANQPVVEIYQAYYDASTKQWMPATYFDPNTQQMIAKDDTNNIYTYNSFGQEVYNYYETDLLSYAKNYYETYNAVSGVSENNTVLGAKLYPNPVQHQLNVSLENIGQDEVAVAIFNANGQVVKNYNMPVEKQLQLNIAELPVGMYAISINHSGKQFSSRFIKTN